MYINIELNFVSTHVADNRIFFYWILHDPIVSLYLSSKFAIIIGKWVNRYSSQ